MILSPSRSTIGDFVMLNNMMIIDRDRVFHRSVGTLMFDFVIVREPDNTYTFLKNRYNGINYEGLTEYQLHEKINDMVIGIIPEKEDVA
jgi:hypothetical protein